MNVNVDWDNVPASKWANGRIRAEADRLARYIPETAKMHLRVGHEGQQYKTKVHVHAMGRDWFTVGTGENLWEGIAAAFEKMLRRMDEFKSVQKNKIHRRLQGKKTIYL